MVVVSKDWLSGMRIRLGHHAGDRGSALGPLQTDNPRNLGILAFEAGRTMSRLVSLHRALSDAEISRLRSDVMRSEGVAYLNSPDQAFLLRLACAEMVDDLDRAAASIARLGRRCHGVWPPGFEHVYADLKAGSCDIVRLGLGFQPKDVEKKVKKMEKYVSTTSALHTAMGTLADMEAGEQRKQGKWKHFDGPMAFLDTDFEIFQKRLILQRDRVRQLREESLWCQSFDKVAEIMARAAVAIYTRICAVFGPFVMDLPPVVSGKHGRIGFVTHCHSRLCPHHHHHRHPGLYSSGPLERPVAGNVVIRNSGPILRAPVKAEAKPWKDQVLETPPNTLGGSGLALRYAAVIVHLERLARSPELVGEDAREELYWMLPLELRGALRAKLRNCWKMDSGPSDDGLMAEGWEAAVGSILGWLAPMAHDTNRWHSDRSFEQRRLDSGSRVLMLQTLLFSDREKTEAAIVELLVGLSCVCWYKQGGEEDVGEF